MEFGGGTATLTWRTASPASTEVDYGLTSAYGSSHRSELRLMTRHVVTLRDLAPDRFYYFRARSVSARETNEVACRFHNSGCVDHEMTLEKGLACIPAEDLD